MKYRIMQHTRHDGSVYYIYDVGSNSADPTHGAGWETVNHTKWTSLAYLRMHIKRIQSGVVIKESLIEVIE